MSAIGVAAGDVRPLSPVSEASLPAGYLARVDKNEHAEILAILRRAENYFEQSGAEDESAPVVLVLNGPEIRIFARKNYRQFQETLDLAAKLSAFNVVDVRICEARMEFEGLQHSDLMPFVGTVTNGPTERSRLLQEEAYVYF